jgi:hypothetical protein
LEKTLSGNPQESSVTGGTEMEGLERLPWH